jgi:hypothetical protein
LDLHTQATRQAQGQDSKRKCTLTISARTQLLKGAVELLLPLLLSFSYIAAALLLTRLLPLRLLPMLLMFLPLLLTPAAPYPTSPHARQRLLLRQLQHLQEEPALLALHARHAAKLSRTVDAAC